ncbi:T9SS type A sorting domain-containing protein [Hymenobacter sp. BRD128]|uniref:T9SS type A sorting domain-containing protein n=1 Tax=Hymenobacter sp. BRD128 TaxID=2675878 RepID=UPI001565F0DD|nr:T9SS type A sorting domain-containing protein [Hymenobacter sp. BRD128]QKG57147.1 T9SS type A sorting domain-containing protein [Hymenobacter sp. BRD128]
MKTILSQHFSCSYKPLLLAAGLGVSLASHAQYMPGNLVVLRVGDGVNSLTSTSAPTYLDEYTPAGVLQSSLPLNNAAGTANKLTNTGNSTSEGLLTLSADGRYLLTTGYNAEVGLATVNTTAAAVVPRTVARVDASRSVDISTALTNAYSGGNIRGAASADGTSFFLSGSNAGVRYAGLGATISSGISTTISSPRVVRIYRNRVYFSTGSGTTPGIYVIDLATNTTSGQTATSFLPTGIGTNSASPYGFVLFDRDPNVPGFDAAYVADDGIGTPSPGIQKWSFDGSAWTLQGIIGSAYRGLTGTLNPDGSATLYATTNTSAGGNQLVSVTDVNAYNAVPSTTAVTVRVTAIARAALRGVEFAPGTVVVLPVVLTGFAAARTAAGVQLRWATASEANSAHFKVERSLDGIVFSHIATAAAAGTSQRPRAYAHLDAGAPTGPLYYRLRQLDLDGTAHYSPVVAVSGSTPSGLALSPNPVRESLHLTTTAATAYTVRTALGQPVAQGLTAEGAATISVASLPVGVYFLELHTGMGRVVQRFVKE